MGSCAWNFNLLERYLHGWGTCIIANEVHPCHNPHGVVSIPKKNPIWRQHQSNAQRRITYRKPSHHSCSAHLKSKRTSVNRSLWWVSILFLHVWYWWPLLSSSVLFGSTEIVVGVMGHNRSSSMSVIVEFNFWTCWNRTELVSHWLWRSLGGITNLHNTPDPHDWNHGCHGPKGTKKINSVHGVQMRRSTLSRTRGL